MVLIQLKKHRQLTKFFFVTQCYYSSALYGMSSINAKSYLIGQQCFMICSTVSFCVTIPVLCMILAFGGLYSLGLLPVCLP